MRIDNPSISGSLSFIQGTNTISGTSVSLTGSLSGTFEGQFSGDSLSNISGAFDSVSSSLASDISLNAGSINSLNTASSSYLLNTTDTLDGDLTVTGKITAQEFHTQFVSASIIFESGSTKFGDSSDDVHSFTGSLNVSGSITGTLANASQPNITSVGTLSSLAVSGNLTVDTNTLFVDAANNRVGIGTTSPPSQFSVFNDTTAPNLIIANGVVPDGTKSGGSISLFLGGSGIATGNFALTNDVLGNISSFGYGNNFLYEGSKIQTVVTNGGNIDRVNHTADLLFFTKPSGTNVPTEKMRITSSGNVGIGTSSPAHSLELKKTGVDSTIWGYNVAQLADSTANNTGLRIATSTGTSGLTNLVAATANDASQFSFWTYNGSSWGERMRINASGNVGIGTTAPAAKLDVQSAPGLGGLRAVIGYNAELNTTISNETNVFLVSCQYGDSGLYLHRSPNGGNTGFGAGFLLKVRNQDGFRNELAFIQKGHNNAASYVRLIMDGNGNVSGDLNDTSDINKKQNIQDLVGGLDVVGKLRPVTFEWKSEEQKSKGTKKGFIAQEVESVIPEVVDGIEGNRAINVTGIVAHLTKAIQELKDIVDQQQIEIDNLKAQLNG